MIALFNPMLNNVPLKCFTGNITSVLPFDKLPANLQFLLNLTSCKMTGIKMFKRVEFSGGSHLAEAIWVSIVKFMKTLGGKFGMVQELPQNSL